MTKQAVHNLCINTSITN